MSASNVLIETSMANIEVELYPEKAPITVENFLSYVSDGFFENTIFHRVIPNFMIQCGGFLDGMVEKQCKDPIKNEADNGIGNDRGTLAMARTSAPDSASSQFFINLKDNAFLDYSTPTSQGWGYCVFGKVTSGLDIVDKISAVNTTTISGHDDVPAETVTIIKTSVV